MRPVNETDEGPTRVLFVCTHNSARSQMAEGMVRAWGGDGFEAFSAGTEATGVRPEAIEVMREIGIDIGDHHSKTILPFIGESFAWVVTVCDAAKEACPVIPGAKQQAHWSIADPSAVEGSEEERLAAFREARDVLRDRVRIFLLAAGRRDLPQPESTRIGG
jgi:arsenate reductase (thioredoxin)